MKRLLKKRMYPRIWLKKKQSDMSDEGAERSAPFSFFVYNSVYAYSSEAYYDLYPDDPDRHLKRRSHQDECPAQTGQFCL